MNIYKKLSVALVFAAALAIAACSKTNKTASAGGGASTQGVLTIKGASR